MSSDGAVEMEDTNEGMKRNELLFPHLFTRGGEITNTVGAATSGTSGSATVNQIGSQ